MGSFSRIRYVIAANVNSLIEKAEDPEKLLRALIREMEDASEDARMASAELLAEQQHLERLEGQLAEEVHAERVLEAHARTQPAHQPLDAPGARGLVERDASDAQEVRLEHAHARGSEASAGAPWHSSA